MKRYGKFALVSVLCLAVFISPFSTFAQETPKFIYGVASWYGEQFEGKPTASGEVFSMNGLTAAHKSLPFGTRLEIENLGNGKKVEVRVNDRGPFVENRILDISKQAAEILDFVGEGKTFVKATVLELGDPLNKPMPAAGSMIAPRMDIPQSFNAPADVSAPTNVIAPGTTTDGNLQASAQDESAYMNDVVPQTTPAPLRTQLIPDINPFGDSGTNNIYGFTSNQQPAPVTDPLGGQDPIMPELDPTMDLTPADNYAIYPEDDTFGDLFSDTAEPKDFFPPNMGGSQGSAAQNVGGEFTQPSIAPPAPIIPPAPVYTEPAPVMPVTPTPTYTEPAPVMPVTPTPTYTEPTPIVPVTPATPVRPSTSPSIPGWSTSPPTAAQAPQGYYVIQLGAFSKSDNAMKVYNALKKSPDLALNNVYTIDANIMIKGKSQNVMRIRVGFFTDENVALQKAAQIDKEYQSLGLKSSVIKVDFLP
ncbi:MAG: septal ring lytic transglycosylase RlpA family protein [Brevinema sp.]